MPKIQIDIGGDSSEFVHQATAAMNAETKLETVVKKTKDGLKKKTAAQNENVKATERQTRKTHELKGGMTSLDGVMKKGIGTVKSFIGAWAGIEGIRKAWSMVADEIRAASAAADTLAQKNLPMEDAVKQIMNQTGLTFEQSEARFKNVMKAGRFSDNNKGLQAVLKGNAAFSYLGKDKEVAITKEVAEFMQRKGLSADQGGMMMEILKHFGTKDVESAKVNMAKIWKASRSSMADFTQFVGGLALGAPEAIAAKASPDTVLANMIRFREGKATMPQAGEMMRQIGAALRDKKVRKKLAKKTGMSEKDWANQTFDQKIEQFGEYISTSDELEVSSILPGEASGRAISAYTKEGFASIKRHKKASLEQTAEAYAADKASYPKRLLKLEAQRQKTHMQGQEASGALLAGYEIKQDAISLLTRIRNNEDINDAILTPEQERSLKGEFWWQGSERETAAVARAMFKGRMANLLKKADAEGDILSAEQNIDATWKYQGKGKGKQVTELMDEYNELSPTLMGDMNAKKWGTFSENLEKVETNYNIIHNYGGKQGDKDNPDTNDSPMGDG